MVPDMFIDMQCTHTYIVLVIGFIISLTYLFHCATIIYYVRILFPSTGIKSHNLCYYSKNENCATTLLASNHKYAYIQH